MARGRAWAVGLTVRYGANAIEFEKGKTAIMVPSRDQLVTTLDTLIEGVKAGELGEHMAQQAKARGVPKSKRAAKAGRIGLRSRSSRTSQ